MPDDPSSKPALRTRALAARAGLSAAARAQASAEIRERLRALPELVAARAVLAYASFGDEVDLDPLLAELVEAGVAVHLPYVTPEGIAAARIRDLEHLVTGYRGVREPPPACRAAAGASDLELALVPGVAFDRRGGRLGYGGGHFDRLLAGMAPGATLVGVAFEAQLLEEVPVEPHDQRLDVIVTEHGSVRP